MIHAQQLTDLQLEQPSLVTIGVFDGVHRGHQLLIKKLVTEAHADGRLAVVLTFYPHPDTVLDTIPERYYLTTPDQRAQLLGEMGVDVVITHPFDDKVRNVRAKTFVTQLVEHLNMKCLRVGKDFALGYQREGDIDLLTSLGTQHDYEVRPIELLKAEASAERVSSSAIRGFLQAGEIEKATSLLGRYYSVSGEVIEGDQRGRTIGFPTANMAVWEKQVLPPNGVYACLVNIGDDSETRFMSATNIGVRPTFDGQTLSVEPHILNFDRTIYGETLTLSFVQRLRDEQKFDGLPALKAQLATDIARTREILTDS
ncbi:MAG: bifunctional riboflavin kinase/FAD synthetase [Chloroflexota bacterium]